MKIDEIKKGQIVVTPRGRIGRIVQIFKADPDSAKIGDWNDNWISIENPDENVEEGYLGQDWPDYLMFNTDGIGLLTKPTMKQRFTYYMIGPYVDE